MMRPSEERYDPIMELRSSSFLPFHQEGSSMVGVNLANCSHENRDLKHVLTTHPKGSQVTDTTVMDNHLKVPMSESFRGDSFAFSNTDLLQSVEYNTLDYDHDSITIVKKVTWDESVKVPNDHQGCMPAAACGYSLRSCMGAGIGGSEELLFPGGMTRNKIGGALRTTAKNTHSFLQRIVAEVTWNNVQQKCGAMTQCGGGESINAVFAGKMCVRCGSLADLGMYSNLQGKCSRCGYHHHYPDRDENYDITLVQGEKRSSVRLEEKNHFNCQRGSSEVREEPHYDNTCTTNRTRNGQNHGSTHNIDPEIAMLKATQDIIKQSCNVIVASHNAILETRLQMKRSKEYGVSESRECSEEPRWNIEGCREDDAVIGSPDHTIRLNTKKKGFFSNGSGRQQIIMKRNTSKPGKQCSQNTANISLHMNKWSKTGNSNVNKTPLSRTKKGSMMRQKVSRCFVSSLVGPLKMMNIGMKSRDAPKRVLAITTKSHIHR